MMGKPPSSCPPESQAGGQLVGRAPGSSSFPSADGVAGETTSTGGHTIPMSDPGALRFVLGNPEEER